MERIGYIYKLTSPSGKVYIGQTTKLKRRMIEHSQARGTGKLQKSIRKYGWEFFTQEIIFEAECSQTCLNRLEVLFIQQYNSFRKGLNMTEGGGGQRGWTPSSETIAKISAALKGKTIHPEVVAKKVAKMKQSGAFLKQQKPVSQLTKEGMWIRDWPSVTEASEAVGVYRSNISRCCKGVIKSSGGYIWKYV